MKAKVRRSNYHWWFIVVWGVLTANTMNNSVFAHIPMSLNQKETLCSQTSLEKLTTQLLRDLPGYANRASQRARRRNRSSDIYSYMLVAGKPEFAPLPLNIDERQNTTVVEQVFFTTLERQYISGKAVESQQFHRLLLTKSLTGWRLVMMFTQEGNYPQQQVVSPPRDSSNGVVAQAVKTWLRDCRAR